MFVNIYKKEFETKNSKTECSGVARSRPCEFRSTTGDGVKT